MLQLGKKKDSSLVGLEIEAGSVAAVEVKADGGVEPARTAIAPLPLGTFHDGEVTDPDALAATLRSLFSEHGLSRRVRLGIGNQRVVVRTTRLPAIDDPKDLEAAVRFQAQEQIPMPIEQAVLDHRVVGGTPASEESGPQIDVVMVAARRDMVEAMLRPLREADLDPIGVDLSAFGLIRALGDAPGPGAEEGEPPTRNAAASLYCNVGDATTLAVAKGRSCLFTRVSPAGLETIADNLSAATGLSDEHARMWLAHVGLLQPLEAVEGDPDTVARTRTALESGADSVLGEIRLSLDFYGNQEGAAPVEQVVLSGPGSVIPGMAERLAAGLGLPVTAAAPAALANADSASAARLTLAYGLALDA
jgi:type IV pilus assembly protein PilM